MMSAIEALVEDGDRLVRIGSLIGSSVALHSCEIASNGSLIHIKPLVVFARAAAALELASADSVEVSHAL
jgi:hypothetical protein